MAQAIAGFTCENQMSSKRNFPSVIAPAVPGDEIDSERSTIGRNGT
jgi:hypothetical protein